jgi:hypothetical protein
MTVSQPLFLIGAGFGRDARAVVGSIRGHSIYLGEYEIDCGYPLLSDLPKICFPNASQSVAADDIEARLAEAILSGDHEPIERLCMELQKADWYLAPRLSGGQGSNPYASLLEAFPSSSYLTFNYDAFLEFGLFRAGRWSPHDGYGVPIVAELGFTAKPFTIQDSQSLVLHLHGSLLVYEQHYTFARPDQGGVQWLNEQDPPHFMFDPYSLGTLFYPFTRVVGGLSYNPMLNHRVIAPVPDKADGLRRAFVSSVKARALTLLPRHTTLVSIGYAFRESDRASYYDLIDAFSTQRRPRVILVTPDADRIVGRLSDEFPGIKWCPQPIRFVEWVAAGYPSVSRGNG